MATHLAAACPAKGDPFLLQSRPTPKPGPGELLIQVKSVALNPADAIMRNTGFMISTCPTVIGFDLSGLVLEVGEEVPLSAETSGLIFQPGITRIAAYAAFVWRSCHPDYGAFQEKCLVPWQHAVPIPNSLSWNHAATLPVAVEVPLNGWDLMGIPRLGEATASSSSFCTATANDTGASDGYTERTEHRKTEALLTWGASSSVGTMGVQSARLLKEDSESPFAAVYATASAVNHEYVRSLGANRLFDYKDPRVVDAIVSAAKEDGLVIRHCLLATGELVLCQAVLKAFLGTDGEGHSNRAKIASAPPIPPDAEELSGVETTFILPSMTDEEARLTQFQYWLGTWLRENLANGSIRPSPEPRVVGKGLDAIKTGLEELLKGVSCTKLVVEALA